MMICPHCGKEADGYMGITTYPDNSATSSGVVPNCNTSDTGITFYQVSADGVSYPVTIASSFGEVKQDIHYHMI